MINSSQAVAPSDPRSGIALILVLGFLSLLIIMAVGFAVSMRVERLVARSSLDHIKSRQLGEAALARVVWDVNESVSNEMVASWSGDWVGGVYESIGSGTKATNLMSGANLLSGYSSNYVPRSMLAATMSAADNAEWLPFEYPSATGTTRVGQYAYVVVDCSGLLDVNFDYSLTNNIARSRKLGESVYELQLTNALLREVSTRATNMMWCRVKANGQSLEKPWIRLETVPEIPPLLSRGFGGMAPLQTNTGSVNLVTYSRIPRGYLEGSSVKQPYVIKDPLDQSAMESAVSSMGLPDPAGFVKNLLDYTDSNNVPMNLDSYCTEAVPLINEIVVSNSLTDVGGGTSVLYRNEYRIIAELWYPFSNPNANSYSVRLIGRYLNVSPAPGTINQTIPVTAPGGSWTMGDFLTVTSTPMFALTNTLQVLNNAIVQTSVRVLEGVIEVDRVGNNLDTFASIPIGTVMTPPVPIVKSLSKSANDPRINWNGVDGNQWVQQNNHTLGRTNDASVATFAAAGADGHTAMYVANRPLRAVGELGLLVYNANKPWQTISLLDGTNYYPVLDLFTLRTNEVMQGLINPNGYNSNVIATVFNRMPVERVPDDPATIYLTTAQLQALGGRFTEKSIAFTNLSDLKFISPQIAAVLPGLSVGFHESVARNSAGLFAPRQQLFAVFLAVQAQDDDRNILAEQRGTGLIWRDPYVDGSGTHATMVRNFRWLTE